MLINITGGKDTSILDINEAAQQITQAADPEANIIFGAGIDESLEDEVHVTVIATGFEKTPFVSVKQPVITPAIDVNERPIERPAAQVEPMTAAPETRADGPQIPSFVNESRFVMPSREERPQTSAYGERSAYAPAKQNVQDNGFEDDPFADEPEKPIRQPAQPRRGFTPDIPPFLRNRRK